MFFLHLDFVTKRCTYFSYTVSPVYFFHVQYKLSGIEIMD